MKCNKIAELETLYGHENDYSLATYNGYDKHITIRHKLTGIVYTQAYNLHKKGLASSNLNFKFIEYILKCYKKFDGQYQYKDYKGFNKTVTVVDILNDKEFTQNAQTHLEGSLARQNTLNNFEVFKSRAYEIFKDKYEYIEYNVSKRKVKFKNRKTNVIYEQLIHEHLKGSICVSEIKDNSFTKLLDKGYSDLYEYSDYVDSNTHVKVVNKITKQVFYQLPKDILKGHKPKSDSKYTIHSIQSYSDKAHSFRFDVLELDTNKKLKLLDKQTNNLYTQGIHEHVYGSLPKSISFSNCSKQELLLLDAVKSLFPNKEIRLNSRPKWLNRKELDIYIPEIGIAIEYNGVAYHHSSLGVSDFLDKTYKEPTYHLNKFNTCLDNGVKLIHIFDYELDTINLKQLIDTYLNNEIVNVVNSLTYVCHKKLKLTDSSDPNSVKVYTPDITFK